MPKNKRLLKMLNETGTKQLVQRMELDAIADRKLPMKQQRMRDLEETLYFVLDEKGHSVHLTDRGSEAMSPNDPGLFLVPDISEEIHAIDRDPELSPSDRIERRRQVESDYAIKSEKLHIIHKLLQAHVLYEKEVDYLVQDGQVMIVDEFTGRVMTGRRWADGLHQAVEAKEGVQVKGETQTFATITIQNYFRMYDKLAGMTGTAETEETEFYSDLRARGQRHPDPPADQPAGPGRPDLQDPEGEARRDHGRGRAAARARLADPDRHRERGCVRDAVAPAQAPRAQARGAEREVPPARGRDRGRGGAEVGHRHRHQHGRPGHRHQTGQGPRPRRARGRAPDHRHRAARVAPHRPAAARAVGTPGRSGADRSSSCRWKTT